MRSVFCCMLSVCLPLFVFCAETYQSDGFCAAVSAQGVWETLTWKGHSLLERSSLHGSCILMEENGKKRKSKLFMDRNSHSEIHKENNQMSVRTWGCLKTPENLELARYEIESVFSQEAIFVKNRIVTSHEFLSHSYPFWWELRIPEPRMRGRGVRMISADGLVNDCLLPETFEKRMKMSLKSLFLAYPEIVIQFQGRDNATVRFEDNRNWAKNVFHIMIHPKSMWYNIARKIPAGTVWEWSFTLTVYIPSEES